MIALWALAAVVVTGSSDETIRVAALLPSSGDSCILGTQYRRTIAAAKAFIEGEAWMNGKDLNISFYDTKSTVYSAWDAASLAAKDGNSVLVGPSFSGPAKQASVVAEHEQIPMVLVDATSPHLSGNDFLMRTCVSDQAYSKFALKVIQHFGWERFSVIHSQTEYGNGLKELLIVESEMSGVECSVNQAFSTDLGEGTMDEEIHLALHSVHESHTRIVVLIAHPSDAWRVMLKAKEMGMTGKGWVWIGVGWAGDTMFNYAGSLKGELRDATEGMLSLNAQKKSGSVLDATIEATKGDCYQHPSCPGANEGGMKCDSTTPAASLIANREPMTDDVFDAIFLVSYVLAHNASLRTRSSTYGRALYQALLEAKNASGVGGAGSSGHGERKLDGNEGRVLISPNTLETINFYTDPKPGHSIGRGDRTSHSLALFNMICTKLADDGSCEPVEGAAEGASFAQVAHFDYRAAGSTSGGHTGAAESNLVFDASRHVFWPGGMRVTPSDRAPHSISTAAVYFLMLFLAMALAFVCEAVLHTRHVTWLPGSGVTMVIGVLAGLIIKV
jgi:ABC-type branched-subunit amino acid transport system substrate-binding protein